MNNEDKLKERIKVLEAELAWAWQNLSYVQPHAAEDYEYDFCTSCHEPEWKHAEDCTAIHHRNKVRELLSKKH